MIFQFSDGEFSGPIATSQKKWKKNSNILRHFREIKKNWIEIHKHDPPAPQKIPSRILL